MTVAGERLIGSIIMGCVLTLLAQFALLSLLDGRFVVGAAIASAAIFLLNTGIHNHRPRHSD